MPGQGGSVITVSASQEAARMASQTFAERRQARVVDPPFYGLTGVSFKFHKYKLLSKLRPFW